MTQRRTVISVPRIHDGLLKSIAYIYPSEEALAAGAALGGTGFLVNTADSRIFLVTNIHIACAGDTYVRLSSRSVGVSRALRFRADSWLTHPESDIAVCEVHLEPEDDIRPIDVDTWFCSADEISTGEYGIGDDVFMCGRFGPSEPASTNNPTSLFGNIARMPAEVTDGRRMSVEAFLIDMRSISGFSGSPVFVHVGPGSFRGADNLDIKIAETSIGLLGIDTGHFERTFSAAVSGPDASSALGSTVRVKAESGIAIVAPAWHIAELIAEGAS